MTGKEKVERESGVSFISDYEEKKKKETNTKDGISSRIHCCLNSTPAEANKNFIAHLNTCRIRPMENTSRSPNHQAYFGSLRIKTSSNIISD